MKIKNVKIENFRAFKNEEVQIDNYNCLLGRNNSGKSTILTALNVFFRNTSLSGLDVTRLREEDFYNKDTSNPVRIEITFKSLSDEALEDFKAYVRHGELVLAAVAKWDEMQEAAPVEQHGSRLVNTDFSEYFELYKTGAKAADLKECFQRIGESYTDLPPETTKDGMAKALRDHEESRPDLCELVEEPNQFYGWSKGENKLKKYIDWVYVPAVKDASEEDSEGKQTVIGHLVRNNAERSQKFEESLNELRIKTEENFRNLVSEEDSVLNNLNENLTVRFRTWGYPDLSVSVNWDYESGKTVHIGDPFAKVQLSDGSISTSVGKVGHGLQRALIVSLLEEMLESREGKGEGFSPIIAIEEPELYQHPPQARHFKEVLSGLAGEGATVLLTSHNPVFIDTYSFEGVRRVQRTPGESAKVCGASLQGVEEKLRHIFQGEPISEGRVSAELGNMLNPNTGEMFFADRLILVEGPEDVSFLSSILLSTGKMEEFKGVGGHIVPVMGKNNLFRPYVVAQETGIDCCLVADGDSSKEDYKTNHRIFRALGFEGSQDLSFKSKKALVWEEDLSKWFEENVGEECWKQARQNGAEILEATEGLGDKNVMLIAEAVQDALSSQGIPQEVQEVAEILVGNE